MQERWRQIGAVVVGRAARDHRGGVGDQLADDFDRLRRRGDDDARIRYVDYWRRLQRKFLSDAQLNRGPRATSRDRCAITTIRG